MIKKTYSCGILLFLLGIISYGITGFVHITALIPSFFGFLILFLGLLSTHESHHKWATHVIVGLFLLGFLGTINGVIKLFGVMGGMPLERPMAVYSQSIMALVCLIYLIFAVRSFVAARRKKNS